MLNLVILITEKWDVWSPFVVKGSLSAPLSMPLVGLIEVGLRVKVGVSCRVSAAL